MKIKLLLAYINEKQQVLSVFSPKTVPTVQFYSSISCKHSYNGTNVECMTMYEYVFN